MKKSFEIILLLAFFNFCLCSKKDAEGDLGGKEYIRGRLFLFDKLTQNADGKPLGEKKVYVSYESSTDTLNYLFSGVTDKEGYFIFPNLKKNTFYRVYYEETIDNVLYKASSISQAPIDSLRLNAVVSATGQNGFHLTVLDATGAVVNGVSMCVFNSPLISGYANNICDGNNFKLTSDLLGHAFRFSLPTGSYYINSSVDINGTPWTSKDTITTVKDKIVFDTIRLKSPNGVRFSVLDPTGALVNGASLCVFNSPLITGYSNNNCDGNSFRLTTDASGRASKYALQPGTYYINSAITINGIPFTSKDTISISNNVLLDTIRLKSSNGINFVLLDSLGTRLPGAKVCIFTSLALYQRDTCEGSNFQLTSLDNGTTSIYSIAPQSYYIYATYINSKFIWVARDTLQLTNQIINDTLMLRKKW